MKQLKLLGSASVALFSASLLTVTLTVAPAHADSACKGLEQAVCVANAECRWQNGYTRKDGVPVESHCRALPKKPEAASPATAQPEQPAQPAQ